MAEAVKNNGRRRRPPFHLRQGYNEDNFDPSINIYSNRGEQYKSSIDPCTIAVMARLLSKFMNSINKKLNENKLKMVQQEMTPPSKKTVGQQIKLTTKQEKGIKQERQTTSSRIQDKQDNPTMITKHPLPGPQPPKQQQKPQRQIPNISTSPPQNKAKNNSLQAYNPQLKNPLNIQSMNKMSEQQFRLIPKGYNLTKLKQQLIFPPNITSSKLQNNKLLENEQKFQLKFTNIHEFRQDTKLFKRASFHVGIAYNIHIENIRQKNPNFGPEELDPTYISKKIKEDNYQLTKKYEQNRDDLRVQDKEREEQNNEGKKMKYKENQGRNQESNLQRKKIATDKLPVYIDLQKDNEVMKKKKNKVREREKFEVEDEKKKEQIEQQKSEYKHDQHSNKILCQKEMRSESKQPKIKGEGQYFESFHQTIKSDD